LVNPIGSKVKQEHRGCPSRLKLRVDCMRCLVTGILDR
jgi:hypothetical protein